MDQPDSDDEQDIIPEKFAVWSKKPPPETITNAEQFRAKFEASRAWVKEQRAKQWPNGTVTLPSARSVVHDPEPEEKPLHPALVDWLHVQRTLAKYPQVYECYEWMATKDPSFVSRLGELEHECEVAATEGRMGAQWFSNPKSYPHLKTLYLTEFGKACEAYWDQEKEQSVLEILSIELGFKKLRFYRKGTQAQIVPPDNDGPCTFYFHEMPTILTESWEHVQRIMNAKSVLGGEITHAVPGPPAQLRKPAPQPRLLDSKKRRAKA